MRLEIGKATRQVLKPTTDVRKIMMADYCTKFVVNTPYFKEGFSYQTGVGGASIASTISPERSWKREASIWDLAPAESQPDVGARWRKGPVNKSSLIPRDFDQGAIESIKTNPNHFEISRVRVREPVQQGRLCQ